jgi:hypothetical protein
MYNEISDERLDEVLRLTVIIRVGATHLYSKEFAPLQN